MSDRPSDLDKVLFVRVASRANSEVAIRLAAQLFNCQPCARCGFVWYACRCEEKRDE